VGEGGWSGERGVGCRGVGIYAKRQTITG
jgi:hypothetical protein